MLTWRKNSVGTCRVWGGDEGGVGEIKRKVKDGLGLGRRVVAVSQAKLG